MKFPRYYFPSEISQPRVLEVDLCAYGSSPAAITAAIQGRRDGRDVALVTNSCRLGGMTSSGLGHTDLGNPDGVGGIAREFYRRVGQCYGVEEDWDFEPKVAQRVFAQMLAEVGIEPHLREFPSRVVQEGNRIREIQFESGLIVRAAYFIDASYEGDLMAMAEVSYSVGREGNETFNELLNGVQVRETHQFENPVDPYVMAGKPSSGLLPGIHPEPLAPTGSGDRKIQAYNFRLCLTQEANRIRFSKPDGYDPLDYELLARYLAAGWEEPFRKFDRIRNGKTDTNNHGAVSTDFIGGNWDFPEASYQQREEIFQAHVRWQKGWLWFLCSDPRVPPQIQSRIQSWGLAGDEFEETGGWPPQLYIREARRLVSDYVVCELHCRGYRQVDDSVGLGSYAMDSHNCQRVVIHGNVRNEGDVQVAGSPPYQIPYRSIRPRRGETENLLVPVCVSASHIAYGSIRMEPVFMILGQSAAIAAEVAMNHGACPVQDIPISTLQEKLGAAGQVIEQPVNEEGRPAWQSTLV